MDDLRREVGACRGLLCLGDADFGTPARLLLEACAAVVCRGNKHLWLGLMGARVRLPPMPGLPVRLSQLA